MSQITQLLDAAERGDPRAAEELLPLVYAELRKLAAQKLAGEMPGQTLQATALVHEAYLRLVDGDQARLWNSRGHFFAAAAESMRRILVDRARQKQSAKHGGGRCRIELDKVAATTSEPDVDLLALDEALTKLAGVDAQAAELVKLRYFAGLTVAQAADALGVSPRTADFIWAFARSWLLRQLGGADSSA